MKKIILLILLLNLSSKAIGQTDDKTYLSHGHNYGTMYSYGISQITIHSDSTFAWKSWNVNNKKEWKNYKNLNNANVTNGKITKSKNLFILTEYYNGNKSDTNWIVKITNSRLVFYYLDKNDKLVKGYSYKRIGLK